MSGRDDARGQPGPVGIGGSFRTVRVLARERTTDFLVFRCAGMDGPGRARGVAKPRPGRVVEFGRTSSFMLFVCSASSSKAEVSAERRRPESFLKGSVILTTPPPSRTTSRVAVTRGSGSPYLRWARERRVTRRSDSADERTNSTRVTRGNRIHANPPGSRAIARRARAFRGVGRVTSISHPMIHSVAGCAKMRNRKARPHDVRASPARSRATVSI